VTGLERVAVRSVVRGIQQRAGHRRRTTADLVEFDVRRALEELDLALQPSTAAAVAQRRVELRSLHDFLA
jgi:hypothetical protein